MRVAPTRVLATLMLCVVSAPAQKLRPSRVYPAFGIGPTGIHATIEKGLTVTVASVETGTPAAETDLRPGDVIESAGGRSLDVADPRVPLGLAIGDAEAGDGRLTLAIRRDGATRKVRLHLRALGSFADKSDRLVSDAVSFLRSGKLRVRADVPGCVALLFLLSTGDAKLLPFVAGHVVPLAKRAETRRNAGGHVNWQLGYQGILLAEYYLRTGEGRVLRGLQELCDWAVENQAAGGWGHGAPVGPGYVQSGLMNHAGLPILIALTLAQECGIHVDTKAYTRAVKLIYRMAGHGCIPYGDHRSELGWSTTNGRNAMAACAFSLLDAPRFQRAAEHLALLVTDSYYQPEFGHTGGGFNVMWRGLGSAHVPSSRRAHYERQMTALSWYFDLCRQPAGGFSMPPTPPDNTRYTGLAWGTGAVGLNYTAPRRTLRITGAPRSKWSKKVAPPTFTWGTKADLVFFSTANARGFGTEQDPPDVVYERLLGKRRELPSVAYCAKYLRHFSPMVRTWAARRLAEHRSADAYAAIAEAARDADPRVRRAAFDAISGYDNWRPPRSRIPPATVSKRFLQSILKTLEDPTSAWWEIDGALFALGRAKPADIRAQEASFEAFATHPDWYLRGAAFWALVGLHDTITDDELWLLGRIYKSSWHVFERATYDAGFKQLLLKDRVAAERIDMSRAVRAIGSALVEPKVMLGYGKGGVHEAAHRTMMILKYFAPQAYALMAGDFAAYLDSWEPYYQHSIWMITGSKWQPGILKVLDVLGAKGRPVAASLKRLLARYPSFDPKPQRKLRAGLENAMRAALAKFEARYGKL